MNTLKTFVLLAALTALLLFMGQAIGGRGGLTIALGLALIMNFASYWWSDKIVLRMHNAQEIGPAEAPELFAMTQTLTRRANMPMPRLYLMDEESPNAFATGRNPNHAAVAVTTGLVRGLNKDEIEGVIAHELAHILHRDTLIMTVAATMAGALSTLANMAMWGAMLGGGRSDDDEGGSPIGGLIGMIVAPFAASLIQMAISRSREYVADAKAAQLTGRPMGLSNALRKIERWSHQIPMHSGSPATAHLFIANPFSMEGLGRLFSTHPPTAERVARLESMALQGMPQLR
ncbi:MAG TPA: zinc metalloprotease HtpX [Solibacterales bacterium]|nr:zinc metalloprotease HtpX [Bryobacterales bacterium]